MSKLRINFSIEVWQTTDLLVPHFVRITFILSKIGVDKNFRKN